MSVAPQAGGAIRIPRALWRLARGVCHLLHGMLVMATSFHSLAEEQQRQRVRWFGRKMLRVLGLQLECGTEARAGATLLVANHVSWLDIIAIHATCPHARFVSKADVLNWPLLGWMIRAGGTLFIERERKRDAVRVVHEMAGALQRGDTLAIFPEGTTGAGDQVLPFHANLLQAAIATGIPVQPVLLRYSQPGQRFSPAAAYVGDMNLVQSLWRVVCADRLRVEVRFLPAHGSSQADRRELSSALQGELARQLGECTTP